MIAQYLKLLLTFSVKFKYRPKIFSETGHKLTPTSRFGDAHGVLQTEQSKLLRIHCNVYDLNTRLHEWLMHPFGQVVAR